MAGLSRVPAVEEILSVTKSRAVPVIAWSDESKNRSRRNTGTLVEPELAMALGVACEYIQTLEVALAKMARANLR